MKSLIKAILTLLIISHVSFSFSQTWPKYYGEPGKYDFSEDIIETYDKGYLMSGNIHDYSNETSMMGWIIKTGINGEILWEKIFDNDLHLSKINAIEQTNNGDVIICGSVRLVIEQTQPIVIKLNACGEKEWCKIFYTPESNPWAQDIKETPSGDIIMLVNQFGEGPEETMHLFKLNTDGDILWKKPYCSGYIHPEGAIPIGESVHITSDQKYIICGSVYWEDPWNPGGVKTIRPTFTMVDSAGNEDWVLPFGLHDTIAGDAYNIIEKPNNEFIGIASYWPSQIEIKPIFVKFDNMGNELGYKIIDVKDIDTSFSEGHLGYILLKDSLYYLSGTFEIYATEIGPCTDVIIDTCLFEAEPQIIDRFIHYGQYWPYSFDNTCNFKLINNSTFKETGNWDIALSKLNLNLEYDTLDPGNYTYDSLCIPGPPQSGFIFLDDCDIVTGMDIPAPEEYYARLQTIPVTVYPNPAKESQVTFKFENTEHHKNIKLQCFDIYGRKVYEEKVYRYQGESIVNVSAWNKGLYVAVVLSEGTAVGRAKFVVR